MAISAGGTSIDLLQKRSIMQRDFCKRTNHVAKKGEKKGMNAHEVKGARFRSELGASVFENAIRQDFRLLGHAGECGRADQ